ncbi:DUF6879 family protein [Streptomyces sp. NPDC039016]|uniref:DUF6879 family protein n=1 Tax=Streptomyces sp. NPDC039016 TaxID=3154330 RepID=UPI0033EDEFD7
MSQSNVPDFAELLSGAQRTAVHLEMRDQYGVGDEVEDIDRFTRTGEITLDPTASFWPEWLGIVKKTLARGVVMRAGRRGGGQAMELGRSPAVLPAWISVPLPARGHQIRTPQPIACARRAISGAD